MALHIGDRVTNPDLPPGGGVVIELDNGKARVEWGESGHWGWFWELHLNKVSP